MEGEARHVAPARADHGAKDHVGLEDFHRGSVDAGAPPGVPDVVEKEDAARGLELQVVAAVVVGGVNIFGGSGSMIGALLGVMLIETLRQSLLRWAGVSEFLKDAILGLLILLAITADAVVLSRLRERWVRTRRRDRARSQPAPLIEQGAGDVA